MGAFHVARRASSPGARSVLRTNERCGGRSRRAALSSSSSSFCGNYRQVRVPTLVRQQVQDRHGRRGRASVRARRQEGQKVPPREAGLRFSRISLACESIRKNMVKILRGPCSDRSLMDQKAASRVDVISRRSHSDQQHTSVVLWRSRGNGRRSGTRRGRPRPTRAATTLTASRIRCAAASRRARSSRRVPYVP